jgi:sugar lactone lactonase YvrE
VYVSCIGEREEEDGSIAKIGLDGTVLELDFITGLGNPHGLAIYGETLYTADDTVLVEISLATRSVVARHIAPEAVFLNDVCTDDEGNVYVSDMRKSAIYRLKDGHFEEWMNTPDLDMPNGLLCDGNLMFVASWGPEWGVNGMLMSMDLDDKELEKIVPFRFGNLDGVQRNGEGWMVSDWVNGAILAVSKEGHPTKVLSTEMSVGDICFIEESGLLFLPMNYQNRMHIYQFKAKD